MRPVRELLSQPCSLAEATSALTDLAARRDRPSADRHAVALGASMRIGTDFDNTIACCEGVLHAAAPAHGPNPVDLAGDKSSVRDHLRRCGREAAFTQLQGHVDGARMELASPFLGFTRFIGAARGASDAPFIVSRRTRRPILRPSYDLHAAARDFLHDRELVGDGPSRIEPAHLFFELTGQAKVARAAGLGLELLIDDLPEMLAMDAFRQAMRKRLFDPAGRFAAGTAAGIERRPSRAAIAKEAAHQAR